MLSVILFWLWELSLDQLYICRWLADPHDLDRINHVFFHHGVMFHCRLHTSDLKIFFLSSSNSTAKLTGQLPGTINTHSPKDSLCRWKSNVQFRFHGVPPMVLWSRARVSLTCFPWRHGARTDMMRTWQTTEEDVP